MFAHKKHPRPDAVTPTKYDHAVPPYLEDFFSHYLKQADGGASEDWEKILVETLRKNIVDKMRDRYNHSSHSKKLFISMNKDTVWENEADKTMRLTRRNIATFEEAFIQELELYVKETLKAQMTPIRTELLAITLVLKVSAEEDDAIRHFCAGEEFFFENVSQHRVEQQAWHGELSQRLPVIRYVRRREQFILEVIKFEEGSHNSSAKKGLSIHEMNEGARYRTKAAKTMEKAHETARKIIDEYQTNFKKAFEIKGVVYQHKIEEQVTCTANVKTNFSAYTRNLLVFHDAGSDMIEPEDIPTPVVNLVATLELASYEFEDSTHHA